MVKLSPLITQDIENILKEGRPLLWATDDGTEVVLGPLSDRNLRFYLKLYKGDDPAKRAALDAAKPDLAVGPKNLKVFGDISNLFSDMGALLLRD